MRVPTLTSYVWWKEFCFEYIWHTTKLHVNQHLQGPTVNEKDKEIEPVGARNKKNIMPS